MHKKCQRMSRKYSLNFFNSIECSMYENGYRALGPDMYVPTPGRVQYYRAETLPFVPVEIKT